MRVSLRTNNSSHFVPAVLVSGSSDFIFEEEFSNYDQLVLRVELENEVRPVVYLNDVYEIVEPHNISCVEDKTYDIFLVIEEKGKKKSIFQEMIGNVKVSIVSQDDYSNISNVFFEIRSKKLETDEVLQMLQYILSYIDADKWKEVPSLSRIALSSVFKRKSHNYLIDLANRVIGQIERNINIVLSSPHSRLLPSYQLSSTTTTSGVVDDLSIQWVTQNLDRLNDVPGRDFWKVRFDNNDYFFNDMLLKTTEENYCVYENRILIGIVANIHREIKSQKDKLKRSPYKGVNNFSKKIAKLLRYSSKLYEQELEDLMYRCSALHRRLNSIVNADQRLEERPKLTAVFSEKQGYHDLYKPICEWYSSEPNVDTGEHFFENIENINDLFEIYIFLKMIEAAKEDLGWTIKQCIENRPNRYNFPDVWVFEDHKKNEIRFFFDQVVRNYTQEEIGFGLIDILAKGYNGNINSGNHRPDYFIKITSPNGFSSYALLDAKFSNPHTSYTYRLRQMVEKYEGRFAVTNGRGSPLIAIGAICCGNNNDQNKSFSNRVKHNYKAPFGFFDANPYFPQRLSIEEHPSWNNTFDKLLKRLTQLHDQFGGVNSL